MSEAFRSTLNTGYITGLGMCKVCTEAFHFVAERRERREEKIKKRDKREERRKEIEETEETEDRRETRKEKIFFSFFFPALPDKCETWSVNNWNEPVIEIKFLQRNQQPTQQKQQNKQHTHTQAKARARQISQGNLKPSETYAPLSASYVLVHRVVLLHVVQ